VRKCQEILEVRTSGQTGKIHNLLDLLTLPVGFRILDPAILFSAPPSDADPSALSLQQMHPRSGLKPVAHFAFRFQVNTMGFAQSNDRLHRGRSTAWEFMVGVNSSGPFIHSIPDELQ
jgi:hypothetical protein